MNDAPRKPLVALLMSLMLPGFGQLYNGQPERAIWLFLGFAALLVPAQAVIALWVPAALMLPVLAAGLAATLGLWGFGMRDAWRGAVRAPADVPRPWQGGAVYALVFVACNLLALPLGIDAVRSRLVESFRIPSTSMEPSVLQGDYLFADKRYNCPGCKHAVARGDIAVFTYPNDRTLRYIKRIIALPGDRVSVRGQRVTVNDTVLATADAGSGTRTEHYGDRQWSVIGPADAAAGPTLDLVVPPGHVFVLGDRRDASTDSRAFGPVPLQDVVGRARQVWWSIGADGVRWGRLGEVLR
jgi:signal peptidase I